MRNVAVPAAVSGILAGVHLGAQAVGADRVADLSQMTLMPALAGVLLRATEPPRTPVVRWTLGALGCSWLGDTVPRYLPQDSAAQLGAMLGSFTLAQLAYLAAFRPWRLRSVLARPWGAAPYVLLAVAVVALCAPGAGPLLPAVVLYAGLLAAMAALATGLGLLGMIGGASFLVSDALIALRVFGVLDPPGQGVAVMATYLAAQALLVAAVIRAEDPPGLSPQPEPAA